MGVKIWSADAGFQFQRLYQNRAPASSALRPVLCGLLNHDEGNLLS
jgi:hypothetical protein